MTLNLVPGDSVYGEKRVTQEVDLICLYLFLPFNVFKGGWSYPRGEQGQDRVPHLDSVSFQARKGAFFVLVQRLFFSPRARPSQTASDQFTWVPALVFSISEVCVLASF